MTDRFSDAFLDELRAAVSITDVVGQHVQWDKGRGTGDDRWCCCPLHGESTPSFHANDREGYWKCHGCGEGGDQFKFLMLHLGVDFPAAVAEVAGMAGIALPEGTGGGKPARPPEQPRQTKERPQPSAGEIRPEIVKTYDYTDRDGALLYQVVRMQRKIPDGSWARTKDGKGTWKTFLQRRPDGAGRWIWSLSPGEFMRRPGGDWRVFDRDKFAEGMETRFFDEGVEHTIYRHPEVEIAIAEGKACLVVEGEKDADTAVSLGFCGTTNSSGSKHWTDTHAANFRDADVVICLDNDEAGDRADKLAKTMKGIARRIRVLNFADHVEGFDHKGDITDWVEKFGGTSDQLEKIIEELPDWKPKAPRSKFGAVRATQIAGAKINYQWLVKGLIEANGLLMFAGEKQSAKTFAALDMGMKIARGLQYGDRKTRQGLVIHMAVEDGKGVRMRVEGYRLKHNIPAEQDIPYIVMDPEAEGATRFSLMSDESVDLFIDEVLGWAEYYEMPTAMIWIDTLSKATEGLDEINGGEVGKVLARVDRIRLKTGATVGLIHHMNASGQRVRGHSSLEANVPNVITIQPMMTIPQNRREQPQPILDGEGRQIRQLTLTKNKNGLNMLKWRVVLEVIHLGFDDEGDEQTTCVCVAPAKTHRNQQDGEDQGKLSPDQKLVYDALVAAQEDAGTDMPAGVRCGPQIKRCTPQAAFVAQVRKTMTFKAGEDEIEARNGELSSFLKRTTTTLINAGYMGRDNDLKIVWWTGRSPYSRPSRSRGGDDEVSRDPPGSGVPDRVMQEIKDAGVPF